MATISITEAQTLAALRTALLGWLPAGVAVIHAQVNRVPEPKGADFVLMTPIMRERLATNLLDPRDTSFTGAIAPVSAAFTGTISGTTLTVTAVASGTLMVGQAVTGQDVTSGTTIAALLTGTGGVGTYRVTPSQVVRLGTMAAACTVLTVASVTFGTILVGAPVYDPAGNVTAGTAITALGTGTGGAGTYLVTPSQTVASASLYAGVTASTAPTRVTVQLDVHGPNGAENTQIISTLLRDEIGCEAFAATGLDVQPLYASDPRQMPFINAERQFENRWTIDAVLQANPVVTVPQQFADALSISLFELP
jgi:hypothetical protein